VTADDDANLSPSSGVAAASVLLDRGRGRPTQTIAASVNGHSWFTEALQKVSERCQYEQAAKQANVPAPSV